MKLKRRWPARRVWAYIGVLAASLVVALGIGWRLFSDRIDNDAYDFFFKRNPPQSWTPESLVLAIDENTLRRMGGQRNYRTQLAEALERISAARPKVVAIDMILADASTEPEDARLERALRATPSLVIATELIDDKWEDPIPRFRPPDAVLAQVLPYKPDGVSRLIPLEQRIPRDRRWALALEAYRVYRGAPPPLESPDDVEVAGIRIPAPNKHGQDRPMLVRFLANGIPRIAIADLVSRPSLAAEVTGKAVFIGVTALSAARDRLVDPYGRDIPGVEIHAQAFETIRHGQFLVRADFALVMPICVLLVIAAGLSFGLLSGWPAYIAAALVLVAAHSIPLIFFHRGVVFSYTAAMSTAGLSLAGAAAFLYFSTRRELRKSESDKVRYQQAIHFVTHEMRTPLTAIQGSSELMGRYNLTDEKRKQMALMINSESKRLARMIQTFLDVERLSEGEMDMKRTPFAARDVLESCVERVRPLADRKQIRVFLDQPGDSSILGDRELLEYAFYNLLTNAVKYSPPATEVHIESSRDGDQLRLAVRDQGIGMDARELKNIFKKFYRTKKAEASGEVGTGIGLSIVEQIVVNHGGRMEVASAPGKGSVFTVILPVGVTASAH